MSKYQRVKDLIKTFKRPNVDNYIYAFFDIKHFNVGELKIEETVALFKASGVDCIIPFIVDSILPSKKVLKFLSEFYPRLLRAAKENKINIGINLQRIIEKSYFLDDNDYDRDILAGVLTKMESYCESGEHIHRTVDMEKTMAITAYDEILDIRINLTDNIVDGVLDYKMPEGNWIINHYICDKIDLEFSQIPSCANRLSKKDYIRFINRIVDILGDEIQANLGKTVSFIYVPELCFDAPNRRDWDARFNEEFFKEYGVDASKYYDAIFGSMGDDTAKIKNALLTVRAKMFRHGVIDAICEFADSHKMQRIYSLGEPKIPANAWLFGDAIKNNSSCAVLDKAYMYGSNSIKLALPAGENTDGKPVYCDIYRDYYKNSAEILYNEAINAFAQGINQLLIHAPTIKEVTKVEKNTYKIEDGKLAESFAEFSRSAQAILSIGKVVSDIAIMYPINSIQSKVNFYQRKEYEFEYPPYQIQNDYMTLMSILSVNCAQDAMYIHPDDLLNNCRIDGRNLVFDKTGMQFRILFLPGSVITSIEIAKKIKAYYEAGGMIIATAMLPKYAQEYSFSDNEGEYNIFGEYVNRNDEELKKILCEIFGSDALNPSVIRPYYKNTNENGGAAYFLPPSKTAADGSLHVQPGLIKKIVEAADAPLDVYMTNLPKKMNSNGHNTNFRDFKGLGMHEKFPYGGLINNIHKVHNGLDIFFFSNTSSVEYHGYAFIKGKIKCKAYNPYNKKRIRLDSRYVNFKGEVYTAVDIHLLSGESLFIFGSVKYEKSTENNDYPNIKYLEYNFLTE